MPGAELLGQDEEYFVREVFRNKNLFRYNTGFAVKKFEDTCKEYLGVNNSIACSSGSAAVYLALNAIGACSGCEVIIPKFTFVATKEAVLLTGATPILCDIDETLTMDPGAIEKLITTRTIAIVPVHMLGTACNITSIKEKAKKYNIPVIEDACQAFGGEYNHKKLGTIGDIGCYSFAFTKTITTGEGGMVVTNDYILAEHINALHDHGHAHEAGVYRGIDRRYYEGFNFRMDELSGAVGMGQMGHIDKILTTQKNNKLQLKELIGNIGLKYRYHYDIDGETGDTLVFRFKNDKEARKFADRLQNHKLFQKILPCALNWHLLSNDSSITNDILSRHIAIPITLNMDIEKTARIIRESHV